MNTMPTDQIEGRLMAEVHFYPYQFALMEKDEDWVRCIITGERTIFPLPILSVIPDGVMRILWTLCSIL
jgi:hypothetical protein